MHISSELLSQPVDRAARVVALELLDKAAKERKRLDDPDDAEALHDFRVAVRRLRSWQRALRPWLEDSIPKKARRHLEKVARLTGDSRDAEVHQQWLEEQRQHLSSRERHGHACLMEQIEDEKRKGDRQVASRGTRAFDRARKTLAKQLHSYRVEIEDSGHDTPPLFAAEMARLIVTHGTTLAECLGQVKTFKDGKKGHAARIAGKRLRYLVEVVESCVEDGGELVTELSEIQDLLGDWHDAEVFCDTIAVVAADGCRQDGDDARPGLRVLAKKLRARGRRAFNKVKSRWPEANAFQPQVEAIAHQLSGAGRRDTEIERKYLLARLPRMPNDAPVVEIDQGYIPGKRVEERLRRLSMLGRERHYIRTFKSGDGLSRMEIEEAMPKALFNRMWPLTAGHRVHKRRYTIPDHGHSWEVDEFLDRDLVLAEVELQSEDEEVEMPVWIASVLVRDVTGESAFSNASLASRDRRRGRSS